MRVVSEALQQGMSDLIGQGFQVHTTATLFDAQLLLPDLQLLDLFPSIEQLVCWMAVGGHSSALMLTLALEADFPSAFERFLVERTATIGTQIVHVLTLADIDWLVAV
jgi:hypothetical protein